jgi:hypothetical protein
VDGLPHSPPLLLILQRFGDAKWETGERIAIVFCPLDHEIYPGTTPTGRGASVVGGREGPLPESTQLSSTGKLRERNCLVVEIYWPEENRTSEVEILKKAMKYGKIDFIGDQIPEMVCQLGLNFPCSSAKTIRQFPSPAHHHPSTAGANQEVEREGDAH